jgi:hypothetical protein
MPTRWVLLLGVVVGLLVAGCGGTSTRLVTVRSGTGSGPIDFSVKNLSDVPINTFYLAKTERVEATGKERIEPNSPEGDELWGPDLSGHAIPTGGTQAIPVASPGNWDARAVDRDGREQLITHLRLAAGGKYILELYDGNWRVYSP